MKSCLLMKTVALLLENQQQQSMTVWLWFLYFFGFFFFFTIPPSPVSLCTGWVFCSLLLSLAGLLPGDPTDCSAAPQTEWVCASHSSPALASHSWYFPSAWLPAPPLPSSVSCKPVLSRHCLWSLNTSRDACERTSTYSLQKAASR